MPGYLYGMPGGIVGQARGFGGACLGYPWVPGVIKVFNVAVQFAPVIQMEYAVETPGLDARSSRLTRSKFNAMNWLNFMLIAYHRVLCNAR